MMAVGAEQLFNIVYYETASGRCPVTEYVAELSRDKNKTHVVASIGIYINRLRDYGLTVNGRYANTMKQIKGADKLYELRPSSSRVLFFAKDGDTFVLLHAFSKTSQKTPQIEIEKAQREMKDYKRRNGHG